MDHDPSPDIAPPDVLLADGDPEDQELFCLGMQDIYPHLRIKLFNNGKTLLEYLNSYPYQALPKCILLEYQMPGLSGPEILQAIGFLPRFSNVPKIVWASLAFDQEIKECLALGAARVLIKPNSYNEQKTLLISLYHEFIGIAPSSPNANEETGEATA